MSSSNLNDAKLLGGLGSILMLLLPAPYVGLALFLVGIVLVLIAIRRISTALGDDKIFNNALLSAILIIIGVAAGVAVVILTGLAGIMTLVDLISRGNGAMIDPTTPEILRLVTTVLGSIVAGLVVFWAFSIGSSIFLRKSLNTIGVKLQSNLFSTAGILYIVGAILAIIIIGFIIILVAIILQIIAFFSLPAQLPQQA